MTTLTQLGLISFVGSFYASSGFFIALLLGWSLIIILEYVRKRKVALNNGVPVQDARRSPGKIGRFMIIVEALDAIPESFFIANSVVSDEMLHVNIIVSLIFMNIANNLCTTIDLLAPRTYPAVHRIMYASVAFAIGMLVTSISVTSYGDLLSAHVSGYILLCLVGGTILGGVLISGLQYVEGRLHRNGGDNSIGQLLAQMRSVQKVEAAVLEAGARNPDPEYSNMIKDKYGDRVKKLDELVSVLSSMERLGSQYPTLITGDASEIVVDLVDDEVEYWETQHRMAQSGQAKTSFNRRSFYFFLILTGLALWTAFLSFIFTIMLDSLKNASEELGAVGQGFTGGAFFATIFGTLIPRLSQDSYRCGLSRSVLTLLGVISFLMGIMFFVFLDWNDKSAH